MADNNWVGWVNRDFANTRKTIQERFESQVKEVLNRSSLNLFYKIIDIVAGIADNMHYYMDQMAREAFLVTQKKSINTMRIAAQFDYRVKGSFSSETLQLFYLADPAPTDFIIPSGTLLKTPSGLIWETVGDCTILQGTTDAYIPALQRSSVIFENVVSDGTANQVFALNEKVVDKTVRVKVNSENWTETESFAYAAYNSKFFRAGLDYNGLMQVQFGDGLNGLIPSIGAIIEIEAYECEGDLGNTLANNVIEFVTPISPTPSELKTENITDGIGGTPAESITDLKKRLPLFVRTLEVAHNESTIKAVAEQVVGVSKAYVEHECGLPTRVYIAPTTNSEASPSLLATALAYLNERKIISINIETHTAGIVELIFGIQITAQSNANNSVVRESVINALLDKFSVKNQEIKGTVELSDIYSAILNISGVSKAKVTLINYKPYAFRTVGDTPLVWNKSVKPTSTVAKEWRLEFASATTFELFINNVSDGVKAVDAVLVYAEIDFSVQTAAYEVGDVYTFQTYPYMDQIVDNLALNEPSFFALKSNDITVNVTGGI